ncbi:MAG TPA: HAD-IIA family hydrolase, partial [Nitriliruptorales bacterium]|nr:HAD-IIA family hydrolase [Nitriliruptorales bacterium]
MSILDRYAGLVIDLDGVIFRVDEPIPEAVALLRRLRRARPPTVFVTNNAARTLDEWRALLARARIEVDESAVLSSAMAVAWMLGEDASQAVLTIGEAGLAQALQVAGVAQTDDPDRAGTVVVGWDRQLTWDKLRRATLAIHRGARFIGTNADLLYPAPEGLWPGNGAALAYLRAATGVAPEVVGKPQTPLFELAAERLEVGDGRILVVGDQVATDIVGAHRMGWDSALVLSGVSSWSTLIGAPATPTWVIRHLAQLDDP